MEDGGREIQVPAYFLCPISLQIMRNPVTLHTGITYDGHSIQQWRLHSSTGHCPSPSSSSPPTPISSPPTTPSAASSKPGTPPTPPPSPASTAFPPPPKSPNHRPPRRSPACPKIPPHPRPQEDHRLRPSRGERD
ncbi:E3 ubiquitin-protein ligase PUB22 [Platanthera zijinensis]|uniref:U-box domain-containing protein n=1 Tax=Platanthera zijinensis TaxID=2320716 RepID=A0AAP0BXK5_9ASPA